MAAIINSLVILAMTVVITSEAIVEELSVGTPAHEVEAFFELHETKWHFFERENAPFRSPDYPWLESDTSYYSGRIRAVRSRWWMPSFGKSIHVFVGISPNGTVSQVVTSVGFTGYP